MNSTIATPFRIVLLFGAICLTGVWMLPLFQVELLPKENTAALTVSFSLPGAAPEIVEQEMTSVLEGACSQLDQLKQIRSVSGRNYGNVQLVFDKSADIPFKIIELAALIRRLRPQFPPDASYPLILEGSGQPERPAMVYVVYTPGASMSVSPKSELMIRSALSGIEDIDEIDVGAGGSRQLVIDFDLARCLAFGVDPQRIVAAVQSFFSPAHPGSFSIGGQTKFIRIAVPDAAPEVLERLHVPTPGNLIRLKDVANVSFEEVSGSGKTRINGRNLVRISIYPRKAANRLVLGEAVRKAMIALKDRLPEQLDTEAEYDDTALLKMELHAHYWRISLSVLLLSCLILLLYRSWRYWSIVMFALLASFSITLVVNGMLRIPVHLYTLAAASVAFGLLADNLVVMLEYYRKQGKKSGIFPLAGASGTTIAALSLIFFLPEAERSRLAAFSIVIIVSLLASLATALWFIPGLYRLIFGASNHSAKQDRQKTRHRLRLKTAALYMAGIALLARYRKSFLVCIILVWGIPLGSLPDHIDGKSAFTRIYNETLGSPYFIRKVRPELDRYLGGMARSFIRSVKANGGLQSEARTRLNVHAVLPQGSTLEQIDVIMQSLENYMQQVTGVERFLTNIYSGEFAMMEISFNRQIENGSFPARLKAALMAKTLDWGGVEWSITGVGQGYNNASAADVPNYLVVMKGYNYRELEQYADRLVDKLLRNKRVEKTNTGENIVDGERSAEEIVLDMDDYQAAIWHTNKQRLVELVHQRGPLSQHQLQALSGGKYYPVMIREAGGMEFSEYDLLYDQMPLDTAAAGRLADMGTLMRRPAAASIHKEDRRFVRKVGFEYLGSKEFGNRFLKNVMEEMKLEMPVGYTIAQEETAWADFFWDDDSKYFLMPLLVVCIFAICAILFESVRKALLIIPIIPAAFIGIFAIFAWGRLPFDQGGYAAFILVGAFAANSAIFIIYDLQTLLRGRSMQRHNLLLIKAITSRTRTILLTGASTACGFLPFLLDGRKEAFWFSFAAGVTGGLIGACIAVWVLLPVLLWKNKIPNPGPS